jgi:hypothetical protein
MSIKNILWYFLGAIVWLVVFSILQRFCVINIPWHIENLWTEQISKDFVKNMAGEVALHATPTDYHCGFRFIYTAKYYPNGVGNNYELVSLTDIVDIDSWKEIESSPASTTYADKSHKLVLYNNSDGIYLGVFDK